MEVEEKLRKEIVEIVRGYGDAIQTEQYPDFIAVENILQAVANFCEVVDENQETPKILTEPTLTHADNIRKAKREMLKAGFKKTRKLEVSDDRH